MQLKQVIILIFSIILFVVNPVFAAVDFYDDFEDGPDVCGEQACDWQYTGHAYTGQTGYGLSTSNVFAGNESVKFWMNYCQSGVYRNQLYLTDPWGDGSPPNIADYGETIWYSYTFFVPTSTSEFTTFTTDDWMVLSQWNRTADSITRPCPCCNSDCGTYTTECTCNPPHGVWLSYDATRNIDYEIDYRGDDEDCHENIVCWPYDSSGGWQDTALTRGQQNAVVCKVLFHYTASSASIKCWNNGSLVLNQSSIQIGYDDLKGPHFSLGQYCGGNFSGYTSVYFDEYRVGMDTGTENDMLALFYPSIYPNPPTFDTAVHTCSAGVGKCLHDGDTNVDQTQAWTVDLDEVGFSLKWTDGLSTATSAAKSFTHYCTDWQACTDSPCTNVITQSLCDLSNLETWTISGSTLPTESTIYIYAKFYSRVGAIDRNGNGTASPTDTTEHYGSGKTGITINTGSGPVGGQTVDANVATGAGVKNIGLGSGTKNLGL